MGNVEVWRAQLQEAQPEHAVRAARKVIERLSRSLAAEGQGPGALLDVLHRHLERLHAQVLQAETLRDTLQAAGQLGRMRAALRAVVDEAPRSRRGDGSALGRWMDDEAVYDRILRELHDRSQEVEVLCRAVARVDLADVPVLRLARARRSLLMVVRDDSRRWPARVAAISALAACCRGGADEGARTTLVDLASNPATDPWVRSKALERWADLQSADWPVLALLRQVLSDRASAQNDVSQTNHRDHMFFEARAVTLAGAREGWSVLRRHLAAPHTGEHARLAGLRALSRSPRPQDHRELCRWARHRSVVLAAGTCVACVDHASVEVGQRVLQVGLRSHPEVARIVLRALHLRQRPGRCSALLSDGAVAPLLELIASLRDDVDLAADARVDAAALLLAHEVSADPELSAIYLRISTYAASAGAGESMVLDNVIEESALLDVLSLVAQHHRTLCAAPRSRSGWTITHGLPAAWTPWRVAHELLHPRPDKRQGWSHAVDFVPSGVLIAPSGTMAEVTQTAVPGRAVCTPTDRWWHPDLPLPSWVLAAARLGRLEVAALPDVRLSLRPRRSGVRARLDANRAYLALCSARSTAQRTGDVSAYDRAVSDAGFSVERGVAGLGALSMSVGDLLSLDGNSLPQLALFSAIIGGVWGARAVWRHQRVATARRRVPLVVGGWGSRGKSGTERLKAALFHELGYTVLSKTTGNEAMVVVGLPGREPVEVYLYRPYDRASIVEQREVLHLARALDCQVLLWECMALNPRYVSILQHDWMRDDITTITNTYPDHEDIQGPGGLEVAETIAKVLPRRGLAITTEQAMAPVLREQARAQQTPLVEVRPETWQLIPADVLARFPYREHPRNIGLVLELGRALGVPDDVNLRAMADRIVPDLGVLKEYGPVSIDGRTVCFVVGNSANERAGFLSNWQRMAFDATDERSGLGDHTVLVVNNRGDRLPRQEVFARVAALDAPVDLLVVIGTNVDQFVDSWRRCLRIELRERLAGLRGAALASALAARLRRPLLDEAAAIEITGDRDRPASAVHDAFERAAASRAPGPEWLSQVAWLDAVGRGEHPDLAIDIALDLIESRLLPLRDASLDGEAVTRAICARLPEGSTSRWMGAANIKGTGLDLVYRWVELHRVGELTDRLRDGDMSARAEALRTLAGLHLGPLASEHALTGLLACLPDLRAPGVRVAAETLIRQLQSPVVHVGSPSRGRWRAVVHAVRANLDLDSIVRRHEADRLMRDLGRAQVGLSRAAAVSKAIVQRQKSG